MRPWEPEPAGPAPRGTPASLRQQRIPYPVHDSRHIRVVGYDQTGIQEHQML